MDGFLRAYEALVDAFPFLGGLASMDDTMRKKIVAGLVVALVPGLIWGGIGGTIQFMVFQERVQSKQGSMEDRLNNLRSKIEEIDHEHAEKRQEIRERAEEAQRGIQDVKGDIRVIRNLLEERTGQ